MTLNDTIQMMDNSDYKERFKAEYYQVLIRFYKLEAMLEKWDNEELDFTPNCPRSTYDLQMDAMYNYLAVLEARAVMENIELENIEV